MKENRILKCGDSVILGVSGGADSICMLYVLNELAPKLKLTLHVIHVNHHIRGDEAQKDADYVNQICEKLNVSFNQVDVNIPEMVKDTGMSEEEAGRHARYQAFRDAARKYNADKIAVAHNLNDNSETVLFNLFRGTGIKGLTGIPIKRDMIIRPLLCCTRAEIENYLTTIGVRYCTDMTNCETEYSRNKIRLELLPYIKENINKKAEYNIVNASKNLEEILNYLNIETDKAYAQYVHEGVLGESGFALHEALQNQIIRKMINDKAGKLKDITRAHVDSVRNLKDMNVSKSIDLPYGLVAVRTYEGIEIKHNKKEIIGVINQTLISDGKVYPNEIIEIIMENSDFNIENVQELMYTKWFDYDKIHSLTLRNRQKGDYIVVDSKGSRKKLKDYFIDEKIPREQRDNILLIADGSHILWAIGYRISAYYKVSQDTGRVIKLKIYGK